MVTTVARTFSRSSGTTDPGPVRSQKATTDIPGGTANFNMLALQLSLMRDTQTTFDVVCPPGWEHWLPEDGGGA